MLITKQVYNNLCAISLRWLGVVASNWMSVSGECLYIWSWQINSGHLCVTLAQYLLSVINSVWLYRMRHITWFSATNLPRWYPVREQEFQVSLSHMNREGLKQIYMWRELPNQPIELSTDKLSRSTHEHVTWPFFQSLTKTKPVQNIDWFIHDQEPHTNASDCLWEIGKISIPENILWPEKDQHVCERVPIGLWMLFKEVLY